jgi:crotonobetainyl-CoA:carnitine CoA-transferase CaiB-like acyl-CoA transferase
MQVIEAWVGSHSSAEVMAAMNEARVPAGPILSTADILAEPQYQQRGMFQRAAPPSGEAKLDG